MLGTVFEDSGELAEGSRKSQNNSRSDLQLQEKQSPIAGTKWLGGEAVSASDVGCQQLYETRTKISEKKIRDYT